MNRKKKVDTERDLTYDWLRLFATIFVVIGHSAYLIIKTNFGGVNYSLPKYTNPFYSSSILSFVRWLSTWVYGFHMPLFFMLSGAVMALKPIGTFEKVIKSKIKRLIFPYFIYGWLFMLPVKLLGNFYTKGKFLLAMKGFLSGIDSGHLWFLPALFWTIIIFTILYKITKRFRINNPYILLIITGTLQYLYVYIPFDILLMKKGISYIFWFALGYCFEYERKRNAKWNFRKTLLAFISLFIIETINKKYNLLNSFFLIICGSFMTYLLSDICNRIFKNFTRTKCWKILISNLFFVYLFHDPLEYIVLRIFMTNGYMSSAIGCILYTVSRTIGVFIISIVLGQLVSIIKDLLIKIIELPDKRININKKQIV